MFEDAGAAETESTVASDGRSRRWTRTMPVVLKGETGEKLNVARRGLADTSSSLWLNKASSYCDELGLMEA